MPIRHIVLFRVHDGIESDQIDAAVAGLTSLADVPGILEWTVRVSTDERKGVVIVENALFESREALAVFAAHPAHQASAERLRTMADWLIGDYDERLGGGGRLAS